ncbi:Prolipoprotein diacylglyceryl transferase [Sulfurivirga caldicuralii]|uniref:Phosphatidylglycerol--prolipoprotein diacylglyceryl transferase n=1 Tax=Sulfurivirga caldicuralii TaxID=364032 RepID=A0A1N6G9L1_9GAMM|nr:prolipoprotein diacylglyceryl transferase [Sulfurivirga caldicuralii]SIO04112.1 Prolipoprotein diacylglyceryl transferase [Sulfurivirga caldicuralii]
MALDYPRLDPVALDLGVFQVRWYGLMYLIGLGGGWLIARWRARASHIWDAERVDDLLFYVAFGVILGGRLGYVLFYNLPHYLQHPLEIFEVWHGGMSFHGGLLGVIVAIWLFQRKYRIPLLVIGDFIAPLVPLGLLAGRIGNFINGELWGRVASLDSPLAMRIVDPLTQEVMVRYPTQLLEALLEGLVLFVALNLYARFRPPVGALSGAFLAGYGLFRFIVEFWRSPDPQLGYLAWGWLTMGQVLSTPMILAGIALMAWAYARNRGQFAW